MQSIQSKSYTIEKLDGTAWTEKEQSELQQIAYDMLQSLDAFKVQDTQGIFIGVKSDNTVCTCPLGDLMLYNGVVQLSALHFDENLDSAILDYVEIDKALSSLINQYNVLGQSVIVKGYHNNGEPYFRKDFILHRAIIRLYDFHDLTKHEIRSLLEQTALGVK